MIRNTALSFVLMLLSFTFFGQIIITGDDMPVPGDTIRESFTNVLDGIDYQPGGPDQTWVFDELTVLSQRVDTFLSVGDTPGIYQLFFNNQFIYPDYNADVAEKLAEFTQVPGLILTDSYLFIKYEDNEYREVGYGVTLEGVQVPVQLQEIDTIYRFPLEYGDIDSAHSLLEIDIPDMGYLMMAKFRRNTVDAWGTLITPYGEFQTLRVKTEINEYDSLYSDSLGIGIPVTRNIIEYKWLANGYHQPILAISEEPFLVTATYMDSVRSSFLSIPEVRKNKFDFHVYPNPCSDYFSIEYEIPEDAEVTLTLFSVYGSELKIIEKGMHEKGYYNQKVYLRDIGIRSGIYIVKLTVDNITYSRKVIIN
jgi:hypothetical protein